MERKIHNNHVYKYWRWLWWNAKEQGRPMAVTFYYQFAEDERVKQ